MRNNNTESDSMLLRDHPSDSSLNGTSPHKGDPILRRDGKHFASMVGVGGINKYKFHIGQDWPLIVAHNAQFDAGIIILSLWRLDKSDLFSKTGRIE